MLSRCVFRFFSQCQSLAGVCRFVALQFSVVRCVAANTRHTAEPKKPCTELFTSINYLSAGVMLDLLRAEGTERSFDAWFFKGDYYKQIVEAWLSRAPNAHPVFFSQDNASLCQSTSVTPVIIANDTFGGISALHGLHDSVCLLRV